MNYIGVKFIGGPLHNKCKDIADCCKYSFIQERVSVMPVFTEFECISPPVNTTRHEYSRIWLDHKGLTYFVHGKLDPNKSKIIQKVINGKYKIQVR